MRFNKYLYFLALTAVSLTGIAQSDQAEYLEAKRLFNQEQYTSARTAFSGLAGSEVFGKYAGFYFGMSAYNQGDTTAALDMWRQLLLNFPQWDQRPELLFWLSFVQFQQGNYNQAMRFAAELTEETGDSLAEEAMISRFIPELEADRIRLIYDRNQESRLLATILIRKLNEAPYEERDITTIKELMEQWDFQLTEMEPLDLPTVKKNEYDIGVFLPFLFESLEETNLIVQNKLVMDLYQGMLLAVNDLKLEGKPVNLWPYDTRRSEKVTEEILQKPEVDGLDLIIGPLYPGPNDAINKFSLENMINTVNPISNNGDVIGGNPLSFLARPSYETMALKMAELAIQENDSNKYAMIFYEENARDSAFASIYRETIENAGFEVVWYRSVNKENSKQALDTLAAQYDVFLTRDEADSIMELPGRFVRDRRIRTDEMRRMEEERRNDLIPEEEKFKLPISYDDDRNRIVFYEKRFNIKPDSVGHIMGATRSNLYANNLISAIETRNDSIRLYGYGDWLDFTMLSYDQLDRLSVALSFPDYLDLKSDNYRKLDRRMQETFKTIPSVNHFRGYEVVWYLGSMMHRYGKYWQKGVKNNGYYPGKVFEGFKYEVSNDNTIVPIIRFNNSVLEVVNRSDYED